MSSLSGENQSNLEQRLRELEEENHRLKAAGTDATRLTTMQQVLDQSGEGVAVVGADGRLIEWNPGMEAITGIPKSQALRLMIWDLQAELNSGHELSTEDLARIREMSLGFLQGKPIPESQQMVERTIYRSDGTERAIQTSLFQIRTAEGFQLGSITRDISKQKAALVALAASEEHSRRLSEATFEAIFLSLKGRCIGQNRAAARMFGYSDVEAVGRMGTDWIHPESREVVTRHMMGNIEDAYQALALRKDGSVFHCEIQGKTLSDGIRVTALRDISLRQLAHEKLLEQQELLEGMFQNVQIGMAIWDKQDRLLRMNMAMTELTGYLAEDIPDIRTWLVRAYPDPAYRTAVAKEWSSDKTGESATREFLVTCKDGSVKSVSFTGRFLKNGHSLVTMQDVTRLRATMKDLADNQYWLDEAQRIAAVGHYVLDLEQDSWTRSEHLNEMLGLPADKKTTLQDWFDLVHPDDREALTATALESIRKVKNPNWDYRVLRPSDGLTIWVHGDGEYELDEQGNARRMFGIIRDITAQKDAEGRILESERTYRNLFETMSQGVVYHGEDGSILSVNPAAEEILGLTLEQLQGRDSMDVRWRTIRLDGTDYPGAEHPATIALGEGKRVLDKVMGVYNPKDDSYRWILVNAVPEFKPGEKRPYRVYATFEDITSLKKAQDKLAESEQTYRNLYHNSPVGLFHYDLQGCITECNRKFVEIIGSSREQLVGLDMLQKLHNEDIKSCLRKALVEGESFFWDWYESVTAEKRTHIRIQFKGIRDETGEIQAGLALVEDTTAFVLTNAALESSEARYRSLVEQSGDAIFLIVEQRLEFFNKRFLELFEIDQDDVAGTFDLQEFIAPESQELIQSRMRQVEQGDTPPQNYEFIAISSSGKRLEVEASVSYVALGDRIATQGILRDITERRQLEEQLHQAQKLEAIGQLAGGVAHDFNNLLTVINGYCDMLGTMELSKDAAESIGEIHEAGRRAARLTSQLLAFSRKQIIQPRTLNLCRLIREHSRMLERLLGEDIQIHLGTCEQNALVLADPGQMEQVLLNLAVNARDAMPKGGELHINVIELDLAEGHEFLKEELKPGRHVCMSVRDTGTGMDESVRARIFEPFFTTKEQGKGTGLGLATIYGIVRQNNGSIQVESEPGQGSCFRIVLPRAAGEADEFHGPERHGLETGHETLLLVEDDPAILEVTRASLTACGYKVICAVNGQEGLEAYRLQRKDIQLVITDVIMPLMGGIELAEMIEKEAPEQNVLFVTGYTDTPLNEGTLGKDTRSFLQKPYSTRQLTAAIRKQLDRT